MSRPPRTFLTKGPVPDMERFMAKEGDTAGVKAQKICTALALGLGYLAVYFTCSEHFCLLFPTCCALNSCLENGQQKERCHLSGGCFS